MSHQIGLFTILTILIAQPIEPNVVLVLAFSTPAPVINLQTILPPTHAPAPTSDKTLLAYLAFSISTTNLAPHILLNRSLLQTHTSSIHKLILALAFMAT